MLIPYDYGTDMAGQQNGWETSAYWKSCFWMNVLMSLPEGWTKSELSVDLVRDGKPWVSVSTTTDLS